MGVRDKPKTEATFIGGHFHKILLKLIQPQFIRGANSTGNFPWWFYTILPLRQPVLHLSPTFYYRANFLETTK